MGKKSFISKSKATKFDLLYRADADPQAAPRREWVESSRNVGIGKPDAARLAVAIHEQQCRPASALPLDLLDEPPKEQLSDARRREIISLGFPDDGYDYLKHMRRGHEADSSESQPSEVEATHGGPSVYISAPNFETPPEDYRAIDAGRLTVHQSAADVDDTAILAGGTSAFSRDISSLRRRQQLEVNELQALTRQFEDLEDSVAEARGDLLEDFVLSATQVAEDDAIPDEPSAALPVAAPHISHSPALSDAWEGDSDASSSDGYHPAPSEGKSFASTYWRPERFDRNENLSVIDERFERLALEYDSDDIGELDCLEDDPSTRGVAVASDFAETLDGFLASHATREHAHEGGQEYRPANIDAGSSGPERTDEAAEAALALAKTKERLRCMEEQEARLDTEDGVEAGPGFPEEPQRETWDCESVLTTRSTLYNHPVKLDASTKPRREEKIQLSAKTGLPVVRDASPEGRSSGRPGHTSRAALASQRSPDETPAEKKERKGLVKEAKRQARASKKELKGMFKEGALQQKRATTPGPSAFRIA